MKTIMAFALAFALAAPAGAVEFANAEEAVAKADAKAGLWMMAALVAPSAGGAVVIYGGLALISFAILWVVFIWEKTAEAVRRAERARKTLCRRSLRRRGC